MADYSKWPIEILEEVQGIYQEQIGIIQGKEQHQNLMERWSAELSQVSTEIASRPQIKAPVYEDEQETPEDIAQAYLDRYHAEEDGHV